MTSEEDHVRADAKTPQNDEGKEDSDENQSEESSFEEGKNSDSSEPPENKLKSEKIKKGKDKKKKSKKIKQEKKKKKDRKKKKLPAVVAPEFIDWGRETNHSKVSAITIPKALLKSEQSKETKNKRPKGRRKNPRNSNAPLEAIECPFETDLHHGLATITLPNNLQHMSEKIDEDGSICKRTSEISELSNPMNSRRSLPDYVWAFGARIWECESDFCAWILPLTGIATVNISEHAFLSLKWWFALNLRFLSKRWTQSALPWVFSDELGDPAKS